MKTLINDYTFVSATGSITFTGFAAIELHKILLITNVTLNEIIYNFACDGFGGTVATNVLTLESSVAGQTDTDKLLIYYDLGPLLTKIDEVSKATTYIAKAELGTATSAALWQALRISVVGKVTTVEYADGNELFDNIWDNRASLSYS